MEKLTCSRAKQFDLVEYMASLGHHPQKIRNDDFWYRSPLRDERIASFKVDRKMNVWYDHGIGKGGNLIDFGTLYFKCTIKDLLERLSGYRPSPHLSFQRPVAIPPTAMIENTGNEPLSDARFQMCIEAFSEDQKTATQVLSDAVKAINILSDKADKTMQCMQAQKPVIPAESLKADIDIIGKKIAEIMHIIESRPKKVFNWPRINLYPEHNPKLFYKALVILLAVTLCLTYLYKLGIRWTDNKSMVEIRTIEHMRIREAWYSFYNQSNKSTKQKMDEAYNAVQMDKMK